MTLPRPDRSSAGAARWHSVNAEVRLISSASRQALNRLIKNGTAQPAELVRADKRGGGRRFRGLQSRRPLDPRGGESRPSMRDRRGLRGLASYPWGAAQLGGGVTRSNYSPEVGEGVTDLASDVTCRTGDKRCTAGEVGPLENSLIPPPRCREVERPQGRTRRRYQLPIGDRSNILDSALEYGTDLEDVVGA
jgi:hypothetical protein